jgi:hypothetical protein
MTLDDYDYISRFAKALGFREKLALAPPVALVTGGVCQSTR